MLSVAPQSIHNDGILPDPRGKVKTFLRLARAEARQLTGSGANLRLMLAAGFDSERSRAIGEHFGVAPLDLGIAAGADSQEPIGDGG